MDNEPPEDTDGKIFYAVLLVLAGMFIYGLIDTYL